MDGAKSFKFALNIFRQLFSLKRIIDSISWISHSSLMICHGQQIIKVFPFVAGNK